MTLVWQHSVDGINGRGEQPVADSMSPLSHYLPMSDIYLSLTQTHLHCLLPSPLIFK